MLERSGEYAAHSADEVGIDESFWSAKRQLSLTAR